MLHETCVCENNEPGFRMSSIGTTLSHNSRFLGCRKHGNRVIMLFPLILFTIDKAGLPAEQKHPLLVASNNNQLSFRMGSPLRTWLS